MSGDVERKLVKALERTRTFMPVDIWERIQDGRMQIWTEGESIAVTEINTFPRKKICRGILMAGKKDDILLIEKRVEAWARENGCQEIRTEGRDGLVPMFFEAGYRKAAIVLSKELTNG